MIDRTARKEMADIIRSYLNERVEAFRSSDDMDKLASQSEDHTVQAIGNYLRYYYDDLKNYRNLASKEEREVFDRLLFILDSGSELATEKAKRWSLRQLLAVCALGIYVILALYIGWEPLLLLLSVPFGLISWLLFYWRDKATSKFEASEIVLPPFSSVSPLINVRRWTHPLPKERSSSRLKKRLIGDLVVQFLVLLPLQVTIELAWLMFAPIALVFQAMPEVDTRIRTRTPGQSQEARP
jgi:hypothetical protein